MPTYANNSILIRAIGHFGTSVNQVDVWTCGWKFALGSTFAIEDATKLAVLQTIAPAVQTFHSGAGQAAGTSTFLDKLTFAVLGLQGEYLGSSQTTTTFTYSSPVAGAGTPAHAWSNALVYTHFSNFPRGKASKGRVYWPHIAGAVNPNTGQLNTVASATDAYQTLVNAMNQAVSSIDGALTLSVLGQDTTHLPGGSAARTGIVVRVGVGLAPDTQRRRDNKVLENHTQAPVQFELPTGVVLQEVLRPRQPVGP